MTGRIEIQGLRVMAHAGVGAAEQATAQPLQVDLVLEAELDTAAASDDVADTVDYGDVAVAVAGVISSGTHALLERLAALAADAALDVDDRVLAVEVTVRKLRPPVPVDVATTAVTLRRVRA